MRPTVSEKVCTSHNAFQVSRLVQALFLQTSHSLPPHQSFSTKSRSRDVSSATAASRDDELSRQSQIQVEDVDRIISDLGIDGVETPVDQQANYHGTGPEQPAPRTRITRRAMPTNGQARSRHPGIQNVQQDKRLIDPASLQNTIDLHNAANAVNTTKPGFQIHHVKGPTSPDFVRPSAITEAQRLQRLKKHFLEKLQEKREKEKNLVKPEDDPSRRTHLLDHLTFDKSEGKGNRIAGEKLFLHENQEKNHHAKGYKHGKTDYEGIYVEPSHPEPANIARLPWVKESDPNLSGNLRLDAEIRLFYEWARATPEEKMIHAQVQEEAIDFVRRYLQPYEAEIFGSQRTGIGIATSDVDVRVFQTQEQDGFLFRPIQKVDLERSSEAQPGPMHAGSDALPPVLDANEIALMDDEPVVQAEALVDRAKRGDTATDQMASAASVHSIETPTSPNSNATTPEAATTTNPSEMMPPSPSAEQSPAGERTKVPGDVTKAPRHITRKSNLKALEFLLLKMKKSPFMMAKLRYSRYPLVQAIHRETGIDVQFVCANDSSNSRTIMQRYISEDPDIVPLFTVLKAMHDVRGLMDVYRGGLGSYTLFMMLVTALRLTKHNSSRSQTDQRNCGSKLLAFLRFWGQDVDLTKNGYSVEPAEAFQKIHIGWTVPEKKRKQMNRDPILKGRATIGLIDTVEPYLLCLQDPADPLNDLGAKTFGIKHIQATYSKIAEVMGQEIKTRVHKVKAMDCLKYQPYSFLYFALGPAYSNIEGRRARIRRGAGEGEGGKKGSETWSLDLK